MKRFFLHIIPLQLLMLLSFSVFSQSDSLSYRANILSALENVKSEEAKAIVADFPAVYTSLSRDIKAKVDEHFDVFEKERYRSYPQVYAYIRNLVHAKNNIGLSDDKMIQYLNVTSEVMKNGMKIQVERYLNNIDVFLQHNALVHNSRFRIYPRADDFNFEYIAPPVPTEADPYTDMYTESEPAEVEPAQEEEEVNWDDFWNTGTTNESQGSEEVNWGDEGSDKVNWDDPYGTNTMVEPEPVDPLEYMRPQYFPPEKVGPIITFSGLDLNIASEYDSVFLTGTKGDFLVNKMIFAGDGGKMDWEIAGLGRDSVFAELAGYDFSLKAFELKSIDSKLTYKGKLKEPIEGIFTYRVHRHDSLRKATFPQFLSYRGTHEVDGIGDENVFYRGGFSLTGAKISSENFLKTPVKLEITGPPGKKLLVRSQRVFFNDSSMSSPEAQVTIVHKRDSIYHPSTTFNYFYPTRQLWIQRNTDSRLSAPFTSSYFNMAFLSQVVSWNMEYDSMSIFIKDGNTVMPTVFQSVDHYEKDDLIALNGIFTYNPLLLIAGYAVNRNVTEFSINDLAQESKIDFYKIETAVNRLKDLGLVRYTPNTGMVSVSYRAIQQINAHIGRTDYDDIILESLMEEDPKSPNATLYLEDERIEVRGVEFFQMSDSLNVLVEPDSGIITLLKNRDIKFDGKITAGNFEYTGKDFTFKYDSFLVNMGTIEQVQFYVTDSLGNRSAVDNNMVGLDSASASTAGIDAGPNATSGTLYINDPKNKSGKIKYPNYPNFNAGMGAVVYFDRPEIFGGRYDRSMFFVVPPFDIDSLGDSDPSAIQFEGLFASGGMFPVFEEELSYQSDNSLGFFHDVPETGYRLYEGSGQLYGDLTMNKKGLRSSGTIEFLSTTLISDDFVFYPDSVTSTGFDAEIRQEQFGDVIFPQANLSNYRMRWLPRKDSLYMYNTAEPFQFYEGTAALDGEAIISNNGVYGKGEVITRGSVVKSDQFDFKHNRFSARNAQFTVDTDIAGKPALAGNDVRLNFNLEENFAEISPEIEGEAAVEFPFAQFKTSIPTARWDLNQQRIYMTKPKDVPLEKSYFYTTRKDLDSLRFNATEAVYDINTQELKVSGIPYIIVADSKITPDNNEVLILENSQIGTLTNTVIIMDTLNSYHRLYDGVIDVKSRNEFSGYATYELVNAIGDTFAIKMTDFRLEDFEEGEGRKTKIVQHTVANGNVAEEENILMSPGMFFKGDVKLEAQRPILQLDGYLKLNLERDDNYNTWIHYKQDANQEKISIDFDNSLTEEGKVLEAGLYFNAEDNSLYALFIEDTRSIGDVSFFKPSGQLTFDEENNRFNIETPGKSTGKVLEGKIYTYDENKAEVTFEGKVDFFENSKGAEIEASVIGNGSLDTANFQMNSFITADFDVPSTIWQSMSLNLEEVIENLGAPQGLGDPTELLYKVANIMGEENTRAYEEQTLTEYVSLGGFSRETSKPLVFSDVNLKWSEEHHSFYSEGLLGMSNILDYDINAAWEGFMEIKQDETGAPVFNLFFKASYDSWYFLSYEGNQLLLFSSNKEFNDIVTKKTNAAKAKLGELVFLPGERAEAQIFVDRFRSQYLGISSSYQLDAEADLNSGEKKKEEKESDDGF